MFTYMSICLPRANIKKNNDIEMHFKKHARKSRLENVSVTLVCRGQQSTVLGGPRDVPPKCCKY